MYTIKYKVHLPIRFYKKLYKYISLKIELLSTLMKELYRSKRFIFNDNSVVSFEFDRTGSY